MARTFLTRADLRKIKRLLWRGERQTVIAQKFDISQVTVSAISVGTRHPEIPWPDKSTGGMSDKQKRKIFLKRKATS